MTGPLLAQIQTGGDGLFALAVAALIALIYLAVIRFMDLNEKEPVWALALAFQQGFLVAIFLPLFTTPEIDRSLIWQPLTTEAARFVALGVAVAILGAVSRSRGWSEIGGPMDGLVYGAAVGLGFAVGETFIRELMVGDRLLLAVGGTFSLIWTSALAGLAHGLFGAIMGAGFGAAMRARSGGRAVGYMVLGFAAAFAIHLLFRVLRSLGGPGIPAYRTWIALAIPVILVGVVMFISLSRERRAIRDHLEEERETGGVTDDELALLRSFGARRAAYAAAFFRADFDYWLALRGLHNRQVQLALAKQRAAGDVPPDERAESEAEAARLRADVIVLRETAAARRGRRGAREEA